MASLGVNVLSGYIIKLNHRSLIVGYGMVFLKKKILKLPRFIRKFCIGLHLTAVTIKTEHACKVIS